MTGAGAGMTGGIKHVKISENNGKTKNRSKGGKAFAPKKTRNVQKRRDQRCL
jgi:hypothetical protein